MTVPWLSRYCRRGQDPAAARRATGLLYLNPGQSTQVAAQDTRPQSGQEGGTLRPGAPLTGPGEGCGALWPTGGPLSGVGVISLGK